MFRPARDKDDVRSGWKNSRAQREQVVDHGLAVENLTRQVEKIRRRILGGSTPVSEPWPPVIYSKTETYDSGSWVWVKSTDTITTAGVTDPDTGLTVLSKAGLWRALKSVSPVTNPSGLPAGTYYHIPQGPYPTPDDPTASNMFWLYFGNVYCA